MLPRQVSMLLLAALSGEVAGHASLLNPIPRKGVSHNDQGCPWCVGEHKPQDNPPNRVNRNARLSSPCRGTSRGGPVFDSGNYGKYPGRAGGFEKPVITAGQQFRGQIILDADHGGDARWEICSHTNPETEECFRENALTEWKDIHCPFECDPPNVAPQSTHHKFDGRDYTDTFTIPASTPSGGATIRWNWVCKWTDEVFVSCLDIEIVGGSGGAPLAGSSTDSGSTGGGELCASPGEKCSISCCQSSMTCYEKDDSWASCLESCSPGIRSDDPPQFQTPWSCKIMGAAGSAATPATPGSTPVASPAAAPASIDPALGFLSAADRNDVPMYMNVGVALALFSVTVMM